MSTSERPSDLLEEYSNRFRKVLEPVARELEALIKGHLAGMPNIDRIAARAKTPERFIAKASNVDRSTGRPKYLAPLEQIQDQIGARVIVFYRNDVDVIGERLTAYFRHIEERELVPDTQREFGYFGRHYVFFIPADAVPAAISMDATPRVFELQVKTLFQHAWSEAEHDLGYKQRDPLTEDQVRRFAFTAAQAWGADHIFQGLYRELADGG